MSILAWSSAITITQTEPGCPPSFLPRHPHAPAWRRCCCEDLKQVWFSAFIPFSQKGGATACIYTLSTKSRNISLSLCFPGNMLYGEEKGKEKKPRLFHIPTKLGFLCNCFNQDRASRAMGHVYCLIRLASRKPFYVFFSKFDTTTKVAPRHKKNTTKKNLHRGKSQKTIHLEQGHNPLFRRCTIKCPPQTRH